MGQTGSQDVRDGSRMSGLSKRRRRALFLGATRLGLRNRLGGGVRDAWRSTETWTEDKVDSLRCNDVLARYVAMFINDILLLA